jgi:preprotein translocase subunit SecG
MLTLIAIVHIVLALSLIGIVLIQDPKDGAMGVFGGGGSSNSFFGSTGAANFLTKATRVLAILFAACCLTLAYLNSHKGGSVMDQMATPAAPANPNAGAPAAPTAPAAPAGSVPSNANGAATPQAPAAQKPADQSTAPANK